MSNLSPRRPGFEHIPIPVEFVVDRVAVGQVFLPVLRFSSVGVIHPVLHVPFIRILVMLYDLSNLQRR
jgi:hypothetical protein